MDVDVVMDPGANMIAKVPPDRGKVKRNPDLERAIGDVQVKKSPSQLREKLPQLLKVSKPPNPLRVLRMPLPGNPSGPKRRMRMPS